MTLKSEEEKEDYEATDEDGDKEVVETNPLLYCSICTSNGDGSNCGKEDCPW